MVARADLAPLRRGGVRRRTACGVALRSGNGGVVDADAVELHCHSAFSFLDGASLPEQLVLTAAELGYRAVPLTDHNRLYGAIAFAHAAKQHGLQAITGAEVALTDAPHVTLPAETPQGDAKLCHLRT